jgi:hypothetical protein
LLPHWTWPPEDDPSTNQKLSFAGMGSSLARSFTKIDGY